MSPTSRDALARPYLKIKEEDAMRRLAMLIPVVTLMLAACGGGTPVAVVPTSAPTVAAPTQVPATPTVDATPTRVATETPAPTQTTAATSTPVALDNESIAEKLRPATVLVVAPFAETAIDAEGLGGGTGILYDKEHGYSTTNAHVVVGASAVKIAQANSNRTRPARVVGRSQCDDIAILQVENTEGLEQATLGDSNATKVGAQVVALGYPESFDLGNDLTVTDGSISKL